MGGTEIGQLIVAILIPVVGALYGWWKLRKKKQATHRMEESDVVDRGDDASVLNGWRERIRARHRGE